MKKVMVFIAAMALAAAFAAAVSANRNASSVPNVFIRQSFASSMRTS